MAAHHLGDGGPVGVVRHCADGGHLADGGHGADDGEFLLLAQGQGRCKCWAPIYRYSNHDFFILQMLQEF